jgi:hypothetical protein
MVDNESTKGAPVIFEANPTYYNVFGRIEKRAFMGTVNTDFTMVQAGSLLNANGGYLIMEIDSVIMNPYVWEALKRTLRTKCLQIEDIPEETGFGTTSLKPEPIPLDVKVILLGSPDLTKYLRFERILIRKWIEPRAPSSSMPVLLPGFARRKNCFPLHPKASLLSWSTAKNMFPTSINFPYGLVPSWASSKRRITGPARATPVR